MDAEALPFEPRDRAVYLPAADALVLADLHLGRCEASRVALPVDGSSAERLAALVAWCSPGTVVLAGDVLHAFSGPTPAVEAEFASVASAAAGAELVVVAGNHDARLDDLCGTASSHRLADGTLVCHGHEPPAGRAGRYVVGHDHPAIHIEGRRHPCYLYGEGVYRGADVIGLPAFDPLAVGTAVNRLGRGELSSPLLEDVRSFCPVVWDAASGDALVFPTLSVAGDYL